MNGTFLILGFFLIIAGVYGYNYASTELTEEKYSLHFDLSKMNDLKSTQNYAIAVSVIGAIIAFAGALDRDPPKT
jgi:predicted negative regulator of RcsB-dependent stress response